MIFCWYCLSNWEMVAWCLSSACFSFSSYSISCSFFSWSKSSNFVLSLSSSWVYFSVISLILSLRFSSFRRSWYSICIVSSFTCVSSSDMRCFLSSRSDLVTKTSSEKIMESFSLLLKLLVALPSLSLTSKTKRQESSLTQKSKLSSWEIFKPVIAPETHWYSWKSPLRG